MSTFPPSEYRGESQEINIKAMWAMVSSYDYN